MNREFKPMSLPLRSVFIACAVAVTVAIAGFIDLLASEPGTADAYAARPAGVIAVQG